MSSSSCARPGPEGRAQDRGPAGRADEGEPGAGQGETQGRNADSGSLAVDPVRTGQSQVPLERLPGGSCRAPDRRPGDRRPRPPAARGADRACREDERLPRAGEPPRRPRRGRRATRRRPAALARRCPRRGAPADVRPGPRPRGQRRRPCTGPPTRDTSPIPPARPPTCSSSTIRSPALTRSRSTPTSAPGPARSSPTTACASCPRRWTAMPRSIRSARARRSDIPWKLSRPEGFNRLTIQVAPGKVRYLVNGHLLYEDDDPSPVSPWLGLSTRASVLRLADLELNGSPTIPREVRSARAIASRAGCPASTARPSRRGGPTRSPTVRQRDRRRRSARASRPGRSGPGSPTPRSMSTTTTGRPRTASSTADAPCPTPTHGELLRSVFDRHGDRGRPEPALLSSAARRRRRHHYEFLYEPGQVMVHPAIDRLAFLLDPAGVKVHWMTSGGNDLSGLPADNAVEEPANRRGPRPIPLKPGQWNAVKLALKGDRIAIELERPADLRAPAGATLGRQFGLFHYKDQTSSQVRNVVLRGNWPERYPDRLRADLAATTPRRTRPRRCGGLATRSSARVSSPSRPARSSRRPRHSSRPSVDVLAGMGPAGSRSSDRPARGRLHAVVSGGRS